MPGGNFTSAEKSAWHPPEKLSPSQWTERNRILPASVAAEAGPINLDRTPHVRGILDCLNEPGVEEIVFPKPAQVAWSTTIESIIGYIVDADPGPILLVMPSKEAAQETMDERIRPLIEHTPAVRRHAPASPHDATLTAVKFDTCSLYMAWAGSPSTLARRAIRYVLVDEADKFPSNAGREADPISLAIERTATFGYRRRILIGSTPTVRLGAIWRAWESAGDKRRRYVPCPHCSEYQTLVFAQIKYPHLSILDKNQYADAIEQQDIAYYECKSCGKPIRNGQKMEILAAGKWVSDGQQIAKDGVITGDRPASKRVGFWINALYSPWRSFSQIAAEHRRCLNDPARMQNFRNSWLAEPWEEVVRSASVEDFRKIMIDAPPAGIVPAWANYIIAGADVQKDRLYWVVRAWGAGYRSQLISYGIAGDFEELRRQVLESQFSLQAGSSSRAHMLCIDSGYRTDEVYAFAKSDERIVAVKGDVDSQKMLVSLSSAGNQWGISLRLLNTQMLKDRLSVLRNVPGRWLLNDRTSDVYLQHLASEQKQIVKGQERWEVKSQGAANHYLDCEVYTVAGAELCRVDLLAEPVATAQVHPVAEDGPGRESVGYLGANRGWLR